MASASELSGVPIFASLSEAQLEELAGWFEEQSVSEDVRLIGEGASGYSFFILVKGAVEVTANDETVATLGPGDFFGEMALLGDGRRAATVTTTEPCTLLVLFGTEFRRLEQAQPEIAGRIAETMRQRADELASA